MYLDFELDGPPMCPPFTYPAVSATTVRVEARGDEFLRAVYVRAAATLGVGIDTVVGEVGGMMAGRVMLAT
jgi:hypothetical protein